MQKNTECLKLWRILCLFNLSTWIDRKSEYLMYDLSLTKKFLSFTLIVSLSQRTEDKQWKALFYQLPGDCVRPLCPGHHSQQPRHHVNLRALYMHIHIRLRERERGSTSGCASPAGCPPTMPAPSLPCSSSSSSSSTPTSSCPSSSLSSTTTTKNTSRYHHHHHPHYRHLPQLIPNRKQTSKRKLTAPNRK